MKVNESKNQKLFRKIIILKIKWIGGGPQLGFWRIF